MGRRELLERAVRLGRAVFHLQVKSEERGAEWKPLATVVLRERVDIDQAALLFTPSAPERGSSRWVSSRA